MQDKDSGVPMYTIGKKQIKFMKAAVKRKKIDAVTTDIAARLVRVGEPFSYYTGLLEGFNWCFVHAGVLEDLQVMERNEYYEYQLLSMIGRVIEIMESMPEYAEISDK